MGLSSWPAGCSHQGADGKEWEWGREERKKLVLLPTCLSSCHCGRPRGRAREGRANEVGESRRNNREGNREAEETAVACRVLPILVDVATAKLEKVARSRRSHSESESESERSKYSRS